MWDIDSGFRWGGCLATGRFVDAGLGPRSGTATPSRKSVHKHRLVSKIPRPLRDLLQARPHVQVPAFSAPVVAERHTTGATVLVDRSMVIFPRGSTQCPV